MPDSTIPTAYDSFAWLLSERWALALDQSDDPSTTALSNEDAGEIVTVSSRVHAIHRALKLQPEALATTYAPVRIPADAEAVDEHIWCRAVMFAGVRSLRDAALLRLQDRVAKTLADGEGLSSSAAIKSETKVFRDAYPFVDMCDGASVTAAVGGDGAVDVEDVIDELTVKQRFSICALFDTPDHDPVGLCAAVIAVGLRQALGALPEETLAHISAHVVAPASTLTAALLFATQPSLLDGLIGFVAPPAELVAWVHGHVAALEDKSNLSQVLHRQSYSAMLRLVPPALMAVCSRVALPACAAPSDCMPVVSGTRRYPAALKLYRAIETVCQGMQSIRKRARGQDKPVASAGEDEADARSESDREEEEPSADDS